MDWQEIMDKQVLKLFYETIKENLLFLVTEYGYRGPFSNFESYVYLVWYEKKYLAIEFHFEIRDEDIGCYIARLVDGKRPDGWLVNEQGEQIRIRLSQWVRGAGIRDHLFTRGIGLGLEEQIPRQIKDYVNLLQKYGKAFLDDKPDVFH